VSLRPLFGGALVGIFAWAAPSRAHLQFPALKAERSLELYLSEAPIRLGYRVAFGAELAAAERRKADRDRDGVVSAGEGNAALDARSAELLGALRVCGGLALDAVECRELTPKQIERVEAEGWTPGPTADLHFAWLLNLGDGAESLGALRIEDAWKPPGVEITVVRIEPPKERALTAAGEGNLPTGVARELTFIEARRGAGPYVVSAAWPAPQRKWVSGAAFALLMALGALLYWQTRRERRSTIG
jgi:hypothetical protein